MICVSIGRGRHRHVMAEHRHLCEQGARLVELRLDYIRGALEVPAANALTAPAELVEHVARAVLP